MENVQNNLDNVYVNQLTQKRALAQKQAFDKEEKEKANFELNTSQKALNTIELFLILPLALIVDLSDYLVLIPLISGFIDIIIGPAFYLWIKFKGLEKVDPLKRIGGSLLIEYIPFLGEILPTWTIQILLIYYKQRKEKQ